MHILVTGGAGFIGSFIVDELVRRGHKVRIFDNLTEQVHTSGGPPDYLNAEAEFIRGDIRDRDALAQALRGGGSRRSFIRRPPWGSDSLNMRSSITWT